MNIDKRNKLQNQSCHLPHVLVESQMKEKHKKGEFWNIIVIICKKLNHPVSAYFVKSDLFFLLNRT